MEVSRVDSGVSSVLHGHVTKVQAPVQSLSSLICDLLLFRLGKGSAALKAIPVCSLFLLPKAGSAMAIPKVATGVQREKKK